MRHDPPGRPPAGLAPADRDRLTQAQAYEDAIAYRYARLSAPCPNCGLARCDEHATDADLITWYRRRAAALPLRPGDPVAGTSGHGCPRTGQLS